MKILLSICWFLITCFTGYSYLQAQNIIKQGTLVIAHRGASAYAPENTIASARLGWELGADAVEVDVHLSADNKIVVIHDSNTGRISGEMMAVSETSLDNLKTLDVGSWKDEKYKDERIPTLHEIVDLIPDGKKLVVEIKSDIRLVPVLERELKNDPKLGQLIFIAFNYETIKAVKQLIPENKAYWLSSRFSEPLSTVLQHVKNDGLDGVDLHYSLITPELMDYAKELLLEVHCWTVDDLVKAKELSKLGVNSITTNIPDKILDILHR